MTRLINLVGIRFGFLVVAKRAANNKITLSGTTQPMWLCYCDCGGKKIIVGMRLRSGKTKSCGCLARELSAKRLRKHNACTTREYYTWASMIQRCSNPRNPQYPLYGGYGVKIYPHWRDFRNFLSDMGKRPPRKTLDRIDPWGNYEPGNCRWATALEQRHNRRNFAEGHR